MILLLAALLPLLIGVVGALAAPRLARTTRPSAAAAVLTAFALSVSLATGLMLCMMGALAVVEIVPQIRPADWAVGVLRRQIPLTPSVGAVGGTVGIALLVLALGHLVRVLHTMHRCSASAGRLVGTSDLAVVDTADRHAFAVPGRHPRIVISTGLLRALSAPERRAVLAHERSHLRHRHHLYAQLARLAVAANPLLRPVARATDVALERWADLDAVAEVGDRSVVLRALSHAALTTTPLPVDALGAGQAGMVERVRCLQQPPAERRRGVNLLIAAVVACWAAAVVALWRLDAAVQVAELATRH